MLHALIMAGGGGTRFWPRSRRARPKQFLSLAGERTLLQTTADRIEARVPPERTWVMTAAEHREAVRDQLPNLPPDQIIGEPLPRDTAACIALGAALVARRDPDALLLVIPSDHVIEPPQEFLRAVHAAAELAREFPDAIITLGIPPTWPSTGYGYVHRAEPLPTRQGLKIFRVNRFREKPNADTAQELIDSGEYYWNAGVFVGRAAAFRNEFARLEPAMQAGVDRIAADWGHPTAIDTLNREFPALHKISFDFAVMEHCPQVLVVEVTYQWDDVGSWLALERLHAPDAHGNTVLANHAGVETHGCIVVGDSSKIITTLGVRDLIIVQDGDCFLVADRHKEGDVKKLVEELKKRGLEQYL